MATWGRAAKAVAAWVVVRSKEPSTYRGLAMVVCVVAAWVNPDRTADAVAAAAAMLGVIEVIRKG